MGDTGPHPMTEDLPIDPGHALAPRANTDRVSLCSVLGQYIAQKPSSAGPMSHCQGSARGVPWKVSLPAELFGLCNSTGWNLFCPASCSVLCRRQCWPQARACDRWSSGFQCTCGGTMGATSSPSTLLLPSSTGRHSTYCQVGCQPNQQTQSARHAAQAIIQVAYCLRTRHPVPYCEQISDCFS